MSRTPDPKHIRCRAALASGLPKPIRAPLTLIHAAHPSYAEEGDVIYQRLGVVKSVTEPGTVLPFEVGKTYKTKTGGSFRILALDGADSQQPVIALGKEPDWSQRQVTTFAEDGQFLISRKCDSDLIPETKPGKTVLKFVEDTPA